MRREVAQNTARYSHFAGVPSPVGTKGTFSCTTAESNGTALGVILSDLGVSAGQKIHRQVGKRPSGGVLF